MFFNYSLLASLLLLLSWYPAASKKTVDHSKYQKRVGKKFLDETALKPGVIKLKSGMLIEILKSGDNPDAKSPKESDSCEVTYAGTLKDGKPFDSGNDFLTELSLELNSPWHCTSCLAFC